MMGETFNESHDKLVEHILKYGDDLSFTKYFWKECEANEREHEQYGRFARAIYLSYRGMSNAKVASALNMSYSTVWTWLKPSQMPKLAHYLFGIAVLVALFALVGAGLLAEAEDGVDRRVRT